MSKVVIAGNASGTGVYTLEAPNGNTDRTLVLPDEAGTVLTSASNLVGVAGVGKVLQVVSAIATAEVATSTISTWVSSGLSASITPTSVSSRILIIASQNAGIDGTTTSQDMQFNLGIFRDSTLVFGTLGYDDSRANPLVDFVYRAGLSYLDSPATTSAVTYTTRGSFTNTSTGSTLRMQYSNRPSSIVLMEIAG